MIVEFESGGPAADDPSMHLIPEALDTAGTWVRLQRHGATLSLSRWPGPHGASQVIVTSDDARFECTTIDADAAGGTEARYRWTDTPRTTRPDHHHDPSTNDQPDQKPSLNDHQPPDPEPQPTN